MNRRKNAKCSTSGHQENTATIIDMTIRITMLQITTATKIEILNLGTMSEIGSARAPPPQHVQHISIPDTSHPIIMNDLPDHEAKISVV